MRGTPTNHLHSRYGHNALVECARNGDMHGEALSLSRVRRCTCRFPDARDGCGAAGMKALLLAGANINCPDRKGTTPLMAALVKNRMPAVEMIVMLGADFSLRDDHGRTALMFSVEVRACHLLCGVGAVLIAS
jgi:hypothetical protein